MNARGQMKGDPAAASQVIAGLLEMHAGTHASSSSLADVLPAGVIARHLASRLDARENGSPIRPGEGVSEASRRSAHLLLLKCLMDDDRAPVEGFIRDIKERHIPFTAVYRQIVSPAMNILGELWSDDEADFVTVTIATSRMQSMVHELADPHIPAAPTDRPRKRILFARLEGEQHTLGLATAIACFSNAGWATDGGIDLAVGNGLRNILGARRYDVLGITLGGEANTRNLDDVIGQARSWSMNNNIKVALGGPLLAVNPESIEDVGADFSATDAVEAVETATTLVAAA